MNQIDFLFKIIILRISLSKLFFATKIQIYKKWTLYKIDKRQYSFMQSDSSLSSEQLPKDFTDKIINIIKNKQQEVQQINEIQQKQKDDSEQYSPPPKQNKRRCKKSTKKVSKDQKDKQTRRLKKSKYLLSQQGQQESNHFDVISEEQQIIVKKEKSTANRKQINHKQKENVKKPDIFQSHQILKEYFEGLLTKVVKKIEDNTNKVLSSLVKKTDKIEEKLQTLTSETNPKENQADKDFNSVQVKQKKHLNIKSGIKMSYLQKIQKKQMTVKQVAKQLKVKESIIQQWIAEAKKRNNKVHRLKLDMLKKNMDNLSKQKKNPVQNNTDLIDSDFLQELE